MGAWHGVARGMVAISAPPTDWLKADHVVAEGQQLSPGKQRHCCDDAADADRYDNPKADALILKDGRK